jgi:hypothetical protein
MSGRPSVSPLPCAHQEVPPEDLSGLNLKEWPQFSFDACPGILGEFVRLTTRDSEADPAAVCITALVRFGAEVYGYAPHSGR